MSGALLDWALETFSGSVAADERYEGPSCVLAAVDNRQYKRLLYEGLDHDPHHDDITALLGRLKTALDERTLTLKGITTDGSARSPDPIRQVFGAVPHQLCPFHVIKALTKRDLESGGQRARALGPVHAHVAARSRVVQRASSSPIRTEEESSPTDNQ